MTISSDPTEDPEPFLPDFAPVPMQRKRSRGWTPTHQRLFIAMLAETGSVSTAARCVGLSARSAYKLREKDGAEAFALAWEDALEIGIGRTRDTILDRWRNGQIVPRWRRGKIVGYERRFNERALIAALQSARREAAGVDWKRRAYREMRLEAAEDETAGDGAAEDMQRRKVRRSESVPASDPGARPTEKPGNPRPKLRQL
ncbi:MAG: hypothetical protein AAGE05_07630 [Pseudomonadota bacterium]